MLLDAQFREVVSGERNGLLAAAMRGVLGLLEQPYAWAVERRNAQFDSGTKAIIKMPAPVISVGNLTVGGTGKTPFVAWLAEWFRERNVSLTIISRGYGAQAGKQNDEAMELAVRLPGVPHVQNADRVAAAREALTQQPRQVLILDDAFQHRRIARDLDIVLLDALAPFGYGRLLPRGLLREPVSGLARASVVALSRSDAVSEARRREIRAEVERHAPSATWLELVHRPERLVSRGGQATTIEDLCGKRVAAFCGIGNPAGFQHTLESCGMDVAALLELPDHCPYGEREIERICEWLESLDVSYVVCTRKDLVKIPREELAGKRLMAVEVGLEIKMGREELERRLTWMASDLG